ncbi:hypothetical protein BDW69DRAFT_185887 [Aspergillus filifer]
MQHSEFLSCPPRPSNTDRSLLVVFLTDWSDGDVQETLNNLQQSPPLKSPNNTMETLCDGSATNGDHRDGKSSVPSFILVSVEVSDPDKKDGVVKVVARRTASDQEDAVSLDILQNLELPISRRRRPCDLTAEHGLVLHNPDAFVFSEKTIDAGHDGDIDMNATLDSLPPPDQNFNIFVLNNLAAEELENVRSTLQQAAGEFREANDKDDGEEKKRANLEKWKPAMRTRDRLLLSTLLNVIVVTLSCAGISFAYGRPMLIQSKGTNDIMHFLVQGVDTEKALHHSLSKQGWPSLHCQKQSSVRPQ